MMKSITRLLPAKTLRGRMEEFIGSCAAGPGQMIKSFSGAPSAARMSLMAKATWLDFAAHYPLSRKFWLTNLRVRGLKHRPFLPIHLQFQTIPNQEFSMLTLVLFYYIFLD
jgi:hypothetical protein